MIWLLVLSIARAEPVLIVSRDISNVTFSPELVKRLYLGKTTSLPSGVAVQLLLPPEGSEQLEGFLRWVGMSPDDYTRHWITLVMSGRGTPPEPLGGPEAVRYVATHGRTIAVVEHSEVRGGVRVIPISVE
jgi:hypothetical protein